MTDTPVSEIIRDWTTKKFPTLDSIPKDAEERNKLFREFATSQKELDPKKHLGVFYTQLEKHVKSLKGNFSDYVKKRQQAPKQTNIGSELQAKVTLEPKQDPGKAVKSETNSPLPPASAASPGQSLPTQPSTTLPTLSPEQIAQGKQICTWLAKLPITIGRLRVPEIPEMSKDEELASGDALYPIFAPYIGNGELFKWIIAGTVMLNIYGTRWKVYKEKLQEKAKTESKPQPQPETKTEQPQLFQTVETEKKPDITKSEKDQFIKRMRDKGFSEEKIREILG